MKLYVCLLIYLNAYHVATSAPTSFRLAAEPWRSGLSFKQLIEPSENRTDTTTTELSSDDDEEVVVVEDVFWPADSGHGAVAWVFAVAFVVLIASVPFVLHFMEGGGKPPMMTIVESILLIVWLTGGIYLFTQVLLFQSPHFGDQQRTLTLVEAVYLFAQIITTVGYGDITPAFVRGQVFVGIFVFISLMLIAGMVSAMASMITQRFEDHAHKALQALTAKIRKGEKVEAVGETHAIPWAPFLASLFVFALFAAAGTCFFHLYPGENKTVGQGVYMSLITLSTVGFGAFTPVTESGMVFGAFWMLFGAGSLGSVVASFTALTLALKKREREQDADEEADKILHIDCTDANGKVDRLGYLRYALLKFNKMSNDEIDKLLKQFDNLDKEKKGTICGHTVRRLSSR